MSNVRCAVELLCCVLSLLCSIAEATPSHPPPPCGSDDCPVFRGQLRLLDFSVLCDLYLCVCWPSKRHFQHHIIISVTQKHRAASLRLFTAECPVPRLNLERHSLCHGAKVPQYTIIGYESLVCGGKWRLLVNATSCRRVLLLCTHNIYDSRSG